jgi:hypothetical protein
MNSYDAPRQAATGCRKLDLLEAQDILSEIAEAQRYLTIIDTLLRESIVQVDPDVSLLLDCYQSLGIPDKIQVTDRLIENARKSLP